MSFISFISLIYKYWAFLENFLIEKFMNIICIIFNGQLRSFENLSAFYKADTRIRGASSVTRQTRIWNQILLSGSQSE